MDERDGMTDASQERSRARFGKGDPRAPGKITPPTLQRVVTNKRLLARLDAAFAHPVVWVHGPPGAGKTTLVASYLAVRKRDPLWYRLDEGDADPATIFFYLAAAAAHRSAERGEPVDALPLLTPEVRGALPLFMRHFMRQLFAARSACLVFDDYHEVAAEAPLHDCLPHGLEEVPAGSHVVIVSRMPPPPQLARLRLNGIVGVVEPETLQITPDEALALARARDLQASPEQVERVATATQGWTAGVILMLEAGATDALPSLKLGAPVPELLFDYFAGEVLRRMPLAARRLLATVAHMPSATAAAAERLTGSSEAAALLEDLRKRNYFTIRDTGAEPHYRFHPLFRAFLLHTARMLFTPDELQALRLAAAAILDADGEPDAAAGLLVEAKGFEALGDLIRRRAVTLVDEGRFGTLSKWLAALPRTLVADDAWLSFYAGETRVWNGEPEDALPFFTRAFELFASQRDTAAQYLAWSGQADAVRLSPFGDQARFDPLIRTFHDLQQRDPDIPSGTTMLRVAFVIASGLSRRGNAREEISAWQQCALAAARQAARPGGVELCAAMFAISDMQDTNFARALRHLDEIPDPMALTHVPVAQVPAMIAHAMTLLYRQKLGDCESYIAEVVAQMAVAGRELWTHLMAGLAVNDAYRRGDIGASGLWLKRMASYAEGIASHRGSHYHYAAAQHYVLAGDFAVARTHADEAVTIAQAAGWLFFEALARATRCEVLLEAAALDEAAAELECLEALLARSATRIVALTAGLLQTELQFARGEETRGIEALDAAMALGREHRNWRISLGAARVARLLARSLRAGIEPDYVREMIRRSDAVSPDPYDEAWPWPIRIVTLGGFAVTVGGAPLAFSRKVPKRLLALLKAIATYGARAVPEQKLIDALWPDDEGDFARNALTIAIHRLRKLLGDADAIIVSGGTVGLDPKRCWVDLWTFEHLLQPPHDAGDANPRCERLFALYGGDFLAHDEDLPWAVPRREHLRARFAKMIEIWAAMQGADADAIFSRAIEAAPKAKALYQGLMRHHLLNGREREGLAVYARLRTVLGDDAGTAPLSAMRSDGLAWARR